MCGNSTDGSSPLIFQAPFLSAIRVNLDCLFIHEHFFETEGIQRILSTKHFPWLKVAKDERRSGTLADNTLYLPLLDTYELNRWIDRHIIHSDKAVIEDTPITPIIHKKLPDSHPFNESYFREMMDSHTNSKWHLSDHHGSLAVIDPAKNLAWINPNRATNITDFSFKYDVATTTDYLKVSRKETTFLQDWIWNLFWESSDFYQIAPEDGHYKILSWPKPDDKSARKQIFQMSACFIQGAKMSKIAEHHNIPIQTIRRFIAANMAAGNIEKINLWDKHYTPPEKVEKTEEQNFIKSFFGKIRSKFGF